MRDKWNDEDTIIRRMQDEKDALRARAERAEAMLNTAVNLLRDVSNFDILDSERRRRACDLVKEWEGKDD